MVYVPVQCPYGQSTEVIKAGKQANSTQRYRCHNDRGERRLFLLQDQDRGRIPEIRRRVVDLARNGSGRRDTVRIRPQRAAEKVELGRGPSDRAVAVACA